MAKTYFNFHQIDDLTAAAQAIAAQFPGLHIDIHWSGDSEAVMGRGVVPTIEYVIEGGGATPQASGHPLAAPIVPLTLGNAIAAALHNPADPHIQALIQAVRDCPVT